jgi:hypothetical protein
MRSIYKLLILLCKFRFNNYLAYIINGIFHGIERVFQRKDHRYHAQVRRGAWYRPGALEAAAFSCLLIPLSDTIQE